jgi:hypothetical protein
MPSCDYCNRFIIFGGVRQGGSRYCGRACQQKAQASLGSQFDPDEVAQLVQRVHEGRCPVCNGEGPIDVQLSHEVWSAMVLTRWVSRSRLACHRCGNKARTKAILSSAVLGWWGIPWGLIVTPMQIFRNISGIMSGPPTAPSPQMRNIVVKRLGAQLSQQRAAAQLAAQPPATAPQFQFPDARSPSRPAAPPLPR